MQVVALHVGWCFSGRNALVAKIANEDAKFRVDEEIVTVEESMGNERFLEQRWLVYRLGVFLNH